VTKAFRNGSKPASRTAAARSGMGETIRTIVYALLIAVVVRTFLFEPFNIPSGSMIPTLLVGDYLFVSKYSYGYSKYSLPFSPNLFSGRILGRMPVVGDVAVFRYPRDTSIDYIKRIIGLPGDRVQVRGGQLYVNGTLVPRRAEGEFTAEDEGYSVLAKRYSETLPNGRVHDILKLTDDGSPNNTIEFKVPDGHFFAMGDNRDNSQDSRFSEAVGFVPMENLIGRAEFIFFSIDAKEAWWKVWEWPFEIRWSRLMMGVR
jgi:signal peptidase I